MYSKVYILFSVDDQLVALPVEAVNQIVRAVQITRLPEAPELLFGLINRGGEMIPVIHIRRQFKLPERDISVADRIIIAQTPLHTIAFIVDVIEGVIEIPDTEIIPAENIFPKMEDYVAATAEYNGRTVLIYDINCLFPDTAVEDMINHLNFDKETA